MLQEFVKQGRRFKIAQDLQTALKFECCDQEVITRIRGRATVGTNVFMPHLPNTDFNGWVDFCYERSYRRKEA